MKYKHIMIAGVLLTLSSTAYSQNNKTDNKMEKNKAIVRNLMEEILSKKKTALLKDIVAAEYTGPGGKKGHEGLLEPVKPLIAAFPDIEWKILDLIGEGDKVLVRWKWTGTHTAQFNTYAATGKTFTNDGMALFELTNGKIISANTITDRLGFLQQMGAVPEN